MTQIKHILPIFLLLLLLLQAETISAQVQSVNKQASPLTISLTSMYVDDINPTIFQELDAYGSGFSSHGQLITDGEGVQFLVDYKANFENYKLSRNSTFFESNQKFYDYQIRLFSRFFISKSWHVDAEVKREDEIQKLGRGISQLRTNVFEADQLQRNSGALTLVYGNDLSARFISLKIFANDDVYKENNNYSSLFNVTQQGAELNVAFRRSRASSLLFKFSSINDDYESATRDDSSVYQLLFGVKWQPTGKSKLESMLGMYWRNYSEQSSNSGLSWLINYYVEPTESWLVKINSARFSDVSKNELTSDSVKQNLGFDISYYYSESWKIGVYGKIEKTEFDQLGQITELDEIQVNIYVAFSMNQHSDVSLSFGTDKKSTSDQIIDYQQSQARLAWQLEF